MPATNGLGQELELINKKIVEMAARLLELEKQIRQFLEKVSLQTPPK